MKAYLVTNGEGHWRVVCDTEFDTPGFISEWSLDEFATGDDALTAYEITVPVKGWVEGEAPQVLIVPLAPADVPD